MSFAIIYAAHFLMGARPTDAEIRAEMGRILSMFPSTESLFSRVQILGSKPLQDFDLMTRVEQIAWMEKYLNSQFRSRIVKIFSPLIGLFS
jgi:hypothetical protein